MPKSRLKKLVHVTISELGKQAGREATHNTQYALIMYDFSYEWVGKLSFYETLESVMGCGLNQEALHLLSFQRDILQELCIKHLPSVIMDGLL